MKLTILNAGHNYWIKGGSDRYQIELGKILETNGHDVIPFVTTNKSNYKSKYDNYFPKRVNIESPGIFDLVRYIYSRSARKNLKKLLSIYNVNIAHLHIYYGQLTASILKPLRDREIPVVQTLHEYKLICPAHTLFSNGKICEKCEGRKFYHALLNKCNRNSLSRSMLTTTESYVSRALGSIDGIDHFIAVSDFVKNKMLKYGIPEQKITTIHNFIDHKAIQPKYNCGSYLLYYGRIESNKGIFTLLQASMLTPNLPLYIVGTGSAEESVKEFIRHHELNHIKLIGYKSGKKLSDLIDNSICTILPSMLFETFGLSIIESYARGKPVIASRIGGMVEVVEQDVDGFLVTPGNVEELATKMKWMFEHKELALEMGRQARRNVEMKYGPEHHYRKLIEVYKKVL